MDGEGLVVGYFFGPKRDALPSLIDADGLTPSETVMALRFGDLGLLGRHHHWSVLGRLEEWDREDWPIPVFVQGDDEVGFFGWVYSEADLAGPREVKSLSAEEAAPLSPGGLSGAGAVEIRLTEVLDPE
jgi:hypothetical protein